MATLSHEISTATQSAKGSLSTKKVVRKASTASKSSTKEEKTMTPTKNADTKQIQRTVFDLAAFDDVKLVKDVPLPAKPADVEEALAMVNNDKAKLLEIIYEGLIADATSRAWDEIEGFKIVGVIATDEKGIVTYDESAEGGEPYTGAFADEKKGGLINAAILSLAKMQGYDKSLSKEKKRELKEKATEFLRSNPAMLASIQS